MARSVAGSRPTSRAGSERPSRRRAVMAICGFDHVVIRKDGAVGGEHDARAHAARDRLALRGWSEEVRQEVGSLVPDRDVDLNDARAHALCHGYESVGKALGLLSRRRHLRRRQYRRGSRTGRGRGLRERLRCGRRGGEHEQQEGGALERDHAAGEYPWGPWEQAIEVAISRCGALAGARSRLEGRSTWATASRAMLEIRRLRLGASNDDFFNVVDYI